MKMKKFLSVVFAIAIIATLSINSFASDVIMPRWSNILVMLNDPAYYGTSSDGALTLSNSWTAQEFSWSELKYIQILK